MFRETVLARALSIAFSAAALTVAVPTVVLAQSSATGVIQGRVESPAGATLQLLNTETGAKRTVPLDAGGNYRATALPTGPYKVSLLRNGAVVDSKDVDVVLGQGVDASFIAAATQTVQVKGARKRIDVSNTNNGAVFTSKELAKLPVASNLTAVTLLAPNTTKADSAYGGASFGGGGASENAYYINGFPVTNPLSQLGGSELPFGAISQVSVLTGGYGAEFGRSIGGVLNVITKSGTNNWEFGATLSLAPNSLRARQHDIYFPRNGNDGSRIPDTDPAEFKPNTDGKIHKVRRDDKREETLYGFFIGGPIIQDKLFMFIAADETITRTNRSLYTDNAIRNDKYDKDGKLLQRGSGFEDEKDRQQRYLLKFDWNLNDNHRLEWTTVSDLTKAKYTWYGLQGDNGLQNPNAADSGATGLSNGVKFASYTDENPDSKGSTSNFLKYTGNLTDKLTLTTLYGESRAPRKLVFENYDVNSPLFQVDATRLSGLEPGLNAQGLYSINAQKFGRLATIQRPGRDGIKSFRLDLEYKLGDHTLRGGLDDNKLASINAGDFTVGGGSWSFRKVTNPNVATNLSGGRPAVVADFGGLGTQGYYVRARVFSSVTEASAQQSSQYIEDRWQVTKNLLVTGGLRNDNYSNSNGDGVKFIDVKNALAPRLSASWDVNGDASLKVFGSAGRYFLQLPTRVAARAASRSTLTDQDFTYTGIDSKGQPTGLRAINVPSSPDNEYGQAKDPRAVVTKDIKPNFQDEVTLGFEKAYSPDLNFGVKATYRKLGAGIDDTCDTRLLKAYAANPANNITANPDNIPCYIFNPGEAATVFLNGENGTGRYVSFTAAQLGYPKIERNYTALDIFFEHPLRNSWYGKVNYTWSRSKGNIEGQTRSDTGQADVAVSAGFDFPEFSPGSNGLLPNDRTHALKAYGFYELTPEWAVGANLLIQSGRPKVCLGTNPDADNNGSPVNDFGGPGYGAEYFFCAGKLVPRGSFGRLPVEKQLDLSLTYKPRQVKGLQFKLDVFNVTNSQSALARRETFDDGGGQVGQVEPDYGEERSTIAPRFAKISVEYNHKF